MYLVRRVFKTKPGEARRVATLVHEQVQIFHEEGHREAFRVAYNDRTCPGEQNIVILEWETDAFQSPYRDGNEMPPAAMQAGAAFQPYIEGTHIEFMELLTPGKMME